MRADPRATGATVRADLHCHSTASEVAKLGVQRALALPECATTPQEVYDLADRQLLALGTESLEVIHTPGHSPGSVTFRWADLLWVGDVLFAGSIGRTDLPGGSFEVLARSIRERLFPLGDRLRVLPGHGPDTTIGDERRSNPFGGAGADLA